MLTHPRHLLILLLSVSTIWLTLGGSATVALAQSTDEEVVIARVRMKNQEELERFARLGLDLLEAREGNDLFILTTREQMATLRASGWNLSVDAERTATLPQPGVKTFQGGYRSVSEMRAFLDGKAAAYPNLAETFVYGSSWERLNLGQSRGHELFGIRLTNKQRPGPKPIFFLMAAIHARELVTSELALRFVDYLLSGYGIDGDATWLLDEHEIIVVPIVNPDGHVIAEQGYLQRKNTNTTYGGGCLNPPTYYDQYGVDLNRNSSFHWGAVNTSGEPLCGQTYPGPAPASEPETSALENLVRSLFPDQRGPLNTDAAPETTSGVLLSIHSYSDLVLWPWGDTNTTAPNGADLATVGRKFASYNGYTAQQSIGLYPTSGTTDDWSYGELGIASYTFEVGPSSGSCGGFFPAFSCLDGGSGGSFWPRNLPALLYAARIARAPYQLGRGPTPENMTATVTGNQVNLQAQFDERWNGGQMITAAEYYVDTPPWRGGTPFSMSATDGSFNGVIETASATAGPITGRHLFYVRAKDANGNWGPVRAAIANISSSTPPVQLSQTSYAVSEGIGHLDITVTRSGDTSSPSTIKYATSDSTDVNYLCSQTGGTVASRKCDYHIAVGTLRYAAGEASKQFSISIIDDVYVEAQETFDLTLTIPIDGIPGASVDIVVPISIDDNDVPGTPNPITQTGYFVRQLYVDLLSREPDSSGSAWVTRIDQCGQPGQPPPPCDRVTVAGEGFMGSAEFFDRQFFVIRLYRTGLGRIPVYGEVGDLASVSGFLTANDLELNKQDLVRALMARPEFSNRYNGLSNTQFVDTLLQTAGVTVPAQVRTDWINALGGGTKTRAQVFREISERGEVTAKYLNEARVISCYYGFFTRNPDAAYFDFLDRLNRGEITLGDLANAFVNAAEYRQRFGPN